MSHFAEYCITCRLRLELISRRTIETIHYIHKVDLNEMHVTAKEEPQRIQYCDDVAYYLRCPKCHNSQPVTVILS